MNRDGENQLPAEQMKNGQFGARESRIHGGKERKEPHSDLMKPALKNLKTSSIIKVKIAIRPILLG